ncbi:bis(5'-nucleosyl)-tetraphosphatase [asymmetrical]-like [Anneissia japonica]|uniref:bis(5'-nucleosyl)-tetraphosphatase [asymmetrical]-like n=1 Tax=Anneissia japonica TaxID=1529436 RepID=UPI0014256AED|nr:bis(5'-nucleosyl)-tetraphosphatase [asymmetrical]-like [Anneissia japonica]XP_033118462.1 bis(5'-nucleosyl)-tetraphosphatase [asymmetrical]-like [Anneissia japonica]
MSALTIKAAGLIVFRRVQDSIQYLLLQASYGDNHWTPPKGLLENGEDFQKAAIRETEEEAGFSSEDLSIKEDFKKTLKYEVRGKPKEVIYWLAELKDPNQPVKLSSEHQCYKWVLLNRACELSKYEDLQETFRQAEYHLLK